MRFSGKTMKEHIQLLTPLFGIIAAVWALRFFFGQVGAPDWLIRLFSVTLIVPVSIILMTLLIRVKRFGGYPSVIVGAFLLVLWSQFLIVAAILLSVFGGLDNIFTAPTLLSSLMGCVLLFMLRRTHPKSKARRD